MISPTSSVRFGTAGWHYADWEGTVFPNPKPREFSPLRFMAREFDFIEVNTTFYRIPAAKLAEGWVRQVEAFPDFRFWVKLNRAFTHERIADSSHVSAFQNCIAPLREASLLEGILVQFPYSFHQSNANLEWVKHIGKHFTEFQLAVEFRHRSWNRDCVLSQFRQSALTWVNIDQPQISHSLPLTAYATHPDNAYFRLHGRNAANWFAATGRDARYDYDYSLAELTDIAKVIRKMAARFSGKIFVSGNNHYKGQAVRNLKAMKEILNEVQKEKSG